jgi:hypothetical protein
MSFTVWIHGTGTYILMECMLMPSLLSLTVCGGIGVITPTDGVATLIMVGEVTHLITVTVAGPMVGAASTVAGVGDGDTITIITILAVAGIPVAVDTGEVVIGIAVAYIRIGVMMEHVIPTEIVSLLHKELHVGVL